MVGIYFFGRAQRISNTSLFYKFTRSLTVLEYFFYKNNLLVSYISESCWVGHNYLNENTFHLSTHIDLYKHQFPMSV